MRKTFENKNIEEAKNMTTNINTCTCTCAHLQDVARELCCAPDRKKNIQVLVYMNVKFF